jgi:hypothetical protein
MIANIYNLTGLTTAELYEHNMHVGKFIKDLTVQNLHDLFFLLSYGNFLPSLRSEARQLSDIRGTGENVGRRCGRLQKGIDIKISKQI